MLQFLTLVFFNEEQALHFILASLHQAATKNINLKSGLERHEGPYRDMIRQTISDIRSFSEKDGSRFSGYAPVLEAVAAAISREGNPTSFKLTSSKDTKSTILRGLCEKILDREADKLRAQLPEIDQRVLTNLYTPLEQLDRLTHRLFGGSQPELPGDLSADQAATYENALNAFLEQHPFLDGTNRSPSGAVFSAAITAHALFSETAAAVDAARYANDGGHTPNPFLIDFYNDVMAVRNINEVPAEHMGFLYESLRARSSSGEIVRLNIDSDSDSVDSTYTAEITIENTKNTAETDIQNYTVRPGTIKFARQISAAFIDAESIDLEIGDGGTVDIHAPCYFNVRSVSFFCTEVSISKIDPLDVNFDNSVTFEARELLLSEVNNLPIVRQGVDFSVSWPGADRYPWTHFSFEPEEELGDLSERLKLFGRLLIAFRSHSKGELARFQDKIEHARMTGGKLGTAIRERLIADGIIVARPPMYVLLPDKLGEITGAKFQDIRLRKFGDEVKKYLQSIAAD